ncbi:MAG: type II toxin-antitoxin system mRNA interferase toxin, RelE/StbE family [Candidatus Pacebacteria bacterium]|nr:type II toxin-antitoxin system mRNA interferase toxin, RelE/StbE family [Candidatus Paceibacterota bacterium]
MKIFYSNKFKKQFKKLPPHAILNFEKKLKLFLNDSDCLSLNNHKLHGEYQDRRSINITGDYRLIFTKKEGDLYLEAVGTHSELYK